MTAPPSAILRRQLFTIWADAARAIANGDHVNVAEIHAQADGIIDTAFAEQARQREARRRRQVATMLRRRR
jgi:hypothetical protein